MTFAARVTPKAILLIVAGSCGLWLALRLSFRPGGWEMGGWLAEDLISAAGFIAYATACWLSLKIAQEHRGAGLMRGAWLALAANAGLSVLRVLLENRWAAPSFPALFSDRAVRGLWLQFIIFPANLCVLVGLAAMWLALRSVGLRAPLKARDGFAMAVILGLLVLLLTASGGHSEARSPYAVARYLQQYGSFFWAFCGVAAVVLHRTVAQMGGGKLAPALRCLMFYVILRATFFLALSLVRLAQDRAPLAWPYTLSIELTLQTGWQFVRWLPAMAAAYRVQMSVGVVEQLAGLKQARAARALVATGEAREWAAETYRHT
jgi:hypothetical protein